MHGKIYTLWLEHLPDPTDFSPIHLTSKIKLICNFFYLVLNISDLIVVYMTIILQDTVPHCTISSIPFSLSNNHHSSHKVSRDNMVIKLILQPLLTGLYTCATPLSNFRTQYFNNLQDHEIMGIDPHHSTTKVLCPIYL